MIVVGRGINAWLGQVHERMEGEILETMRIQITSKMMCHKGGRERNGDLAGVKRGSRRGVFKDGRNNSTFE